MQAASDHHDKVREIVFGIAEHIFDDTRTLYS